MDWASLRSLRLCRKREGGGQAERGNMERKMSEKLGRWAMLVVMDRRIRRPSSSRAREMTGRRVLDDVKAGGTRRPAGRPLPKTGIRTFFNPSHVSG